MNRRLITARTAMVLATAGLVLATGPAICQTVGKAAAVNPAASSSGRTLTLGSPVIHKERIRTDTGGSVQLLFIDRTTLNIGPNSDVLIDEYVFDPATNTGKMSVSLGKGLMRFVGGQISHTGNAQVKTPSAVIGIRGAISTFSYNPLTKVTTVSNDCRHCTLTLFAPNGQTVLIPPGQTLTTRGDSNVRVAPTTKQDTDRNLKATQSKGRQSGGAGRNTSQQASGLSSSKQLGTATPVTSPGGTGLGNDSTIKELTQTRQTTTGNTGAKVSPPPPPRPPPPPPPPPTAAAATTAAATAAAMSSFSQGMLLIMPRGDAIKTVACFLLGGALAASGGIRTAAAEPRLWDGAVVIEAQTDQCNAFTDIVGSYRAVYRQQVKASDPKAAVMVQTDDLTHIILLQATTPSNLNGAGPYCGTLFQAAKGESSDWCGTYQLTATATAQEIKVTGRISKFVNIAGCTIRIRGAFRSRVGIKAGM